MTSLAAAVMANEGRRHRENYSVMAQRERRRNRRAIWLLVAAFAERALDEREPEKCTHIARLGSGIPRN